MTTKDFQIVEKAHPWPFSSPVGKSAVSSTLHNNLERRHYFWSPVHGLGRLFCNRLLSFR